MSRQTPHPGWRYESRPSNETLDLEECWELMAAQPVGRIGFVADGYPRIFPVNFTVLDGHIYFRTTHDGPIGAHVVNQAVAFEVDDVDKFLQAGWSVLVLGRAEHVDDPSTCDALAAATGHEPWAEGDRTLVIGVTGEHVSGRRVRPG